MLTGLVTGPVTGPVADNNVLTSGVAKKLRERPTVAPEFYKAHGHGNDYLVFEAGRGAALTPAVVRRICHRWRGPGADGIVALDAGAHRDVSSLRMFNPDGSEFERSGNGLRIAALYLHDKGRVGEESFTVAVGGDRVEMSVSPGVRSGERLVRVDMGLVTFPEGEPFVRPGSVSEQGTIELDPGLTVYPVSVGNPHAVVFGQTWTRDEVDRLGPYIATHSTFPQGTNVQFADSLVGRRVPIHIWERGVGPTASSGTSACAVAAAAVRVGLLSPGRVTIGMAGGDFDVVVSEAGAAVLEGPVQAVYEGRLFMEFLGGARGCPQKYTAF